MKKTDAIYVAGHTGLAGSAIVRALHKHGYTNVIVRTHHELDLLKRDAVKHFFDAENPAYVVLAAARVGGIKANMAKPADFLFDNLEMQNNVIGEALAHDVKKFLFLGSSCVFPRLCPQPMKEEYLLTGPVEPTNEGYAIAKIAGLKLCEKIFEQHNRCFISCMPPNLYGFNDHFHPEYAHVLQGLMRRMHEAKQKGDAQFSVWGTGKTRREFLFADDFAEAVVWMLETYNQKEFLNIGSGEDIAIRDLAYLIKTVVGYEGEIVFDTSQPDGMPQKLLDVTRAHELGWHHTTGLEDGIRQVYEDYKSSAAQN